MGFTKSVATALTRWVAYKESVDGLYQYEVLTGKYNPHAARMELVRYATEEGATPLTAVTGVSAAECASRWYKFIAEVIEGDGKNKVIIDPHGLQWHEEIVT